VNGNRELFGDLLVQFNDHAAFVVLDLLKRYAADDAEAMR
jgi:hypothetical protein